MVNYLSKAHRSKLRAQAEKTAKEQLYSTRPEGQTPSAFSVQEAEPRDDAFLGESDNFASADFDVQLWCPSSVFDEEVPEWWDEERLVAALDSGGVRAAATSSSDISGSGSGSNGVTTSRQEARAGVLPLPPPARPLLAAA